jgi:magnesium transporter
MKPLSIAPGGHLQQAGSSEFVWIRIEEGTDAEWRQIQEEFEIHALSIEDARKRRQRSKVEQFGNYHFVSVRTLPEGFNGEGLILDEFGEIDVFLGHRFVITSSDGAGYILDEAERRLHSAVTRVTPERLLYTILDHIVDLLFPVMDGIDERIALMEERVYEALDVEAQSAMANALKICER